MSDVDNSVPVVEVPPIRFPAGQDFGPWGVCSIGMSWWVIHSVTLESQCVGLIGKRETFATALAEAARRNLAEGV